MRDNLIYMPTNGSSQLLLTQSLHCGAFDIDVLRESALSVSSVSVPRKYFIPELNEKERDAFFVCQQRQMRFNQIEILYDLRRSLRDGVKSEAEYKLARSEYVNKMAGKIGIVDFDHNGNQLKLTITLTPYSAYQLWANPGVPDRLLRLASLAATAAIFSTCDSRLVVQLRSEKNHFYGGAVGASAAGFLDAKMKPRSGPTPEEIATQDVLANITRNEAVEELGLVPQEMVEMRILGLATDRVKPHQEFLIAGRIALTEGQLLERVAKNMESNDDAAQNFLAERVVTIDGTPEAIESLLTQLRAPITPTHAAAFIAFGYSEVFRRDGAEQAATWKHRVVRGLRSAQSAIDESVVNHTNGAFNGYAPHLPPADQGLPSALQELRRIGLNPRGLVEE